MADTPPSPFTVNHLIHWADVQEQATNAATDPNWDPRKAGFAITSQLPIPAQDAKLPNGFRFPSSVMNDRQRLVFNAIISKQYTGPDPTTSPAFDRVLTRYGEDLTTQTARRFLSDLIRLHKRSVEAAGAMSLDEAMDLIEGKKPPTDPPAGSSQYVTLDQMAAAVHRSKRTLEKLSGRKKNPLPDPDIQGGGGRPNEWKWERIRPWLEVEYQRPLPDRFFGG